MSHIPIYGKLCKTIWKYMYVTTTYDLIAGLPFQYKKWKFKLEKLFVSIFGVSVSFTKLCDLSYLALKLKAPYMYNYCLKCHLPLISLSHILNSRQFNKNCLLLFWWEAHVFCNGFSFMSASWPENLMWNIIIMWVTPFCAVSYHRPSLLWHTK